MCGNWRICEFVSGALWCSSASHLLVRHLPPSFQRHDLLGGKDVPELASAPMSLLPSLRGFLENYGANPQAASATAVNPKQQQQQRQQVETMQKQAVHFATMSQSFHQEVGVYNFSVYLFLIFSLSFLPLNRALRNQVQKHRVWDMWYLDLFLLGCDFLIFFEFADLVL